MSKEELIKGAERRVKYIEEALNKMQDRLSEFKKQLRYDEQNTSRDMDTNNNVIVTDSPELEDPYIEVMPQEQMSQYQLGYKEGREDGYIAGLQKGLKVGKAAGSIDQRNKDSRTLEGHKQTIQNLKIEIAKLRLGRQAVSVP